MNFNEELQKLREAKKQCLSEIQGVEDEKNAKLEQIEQARKKALSTYYELRQAKYQDLATHNNRTDAYCKLIESYSYFDAREIGTAIASLIRTFEGMNYIYQEADYYTAEVIPLAFDKLEDKVTRRPRIIIAEDSKRNWYTDNKGESLNSFVKNGKAIILSPASFATRIPFYRANTATHTLEQCVKLGRFSYVQNFIDELISYKMEHNLKDISSDELERLKIDFISSRVEQIEENHRLVAEQQEEQMRQKLEADRENRQLQLKRIIDKKQKQNQ